MHSSLRDCNVPIICLLCNLWGPSWTCNLFTPRRLYPALVYRSTAFSGFFSESPSAPNWYSFKSKIICVDEIEASCASLVPVLVEVLIRDCASIGGAIGAPRVLVAELQFCSSTRSVMNPSEVASCSSAESVGMAHPSIV
jgi:hypothetical protein